MKLFHRLVHHGDVRRVASVLGREDAPGEQLDAERREVVGGDRRPPDFLLVEVGHWGTALDQNVRAVDERAEREARRVRSGAHAGQRPDPLEEIAVEGPCERWLRKLRLGQGDPRRQQAVVLKAGVDVRQAAVAREE
jgi:hypothetical protein